MMYISCVIKMCGLNSGTVAYIDGLFGNRCLLVRCFTICDKYLINSLLVILCYFFKCILS